MSLKKYHPYAMLKTVDCVESVQFYGPTKKEFLFRIRIVGTTRQVLSTGEICPQKPIDYWVLPKSYEAWVPFFWV